MLTRAGLLVVALASATAIATSSAFAQAAWLDAPPGSTWNTPAGAIPQAPPLHNNDPRCRASEVAPATPEASLLAARGWRVESYWPAASRGGLVVLAALAEYDGMCRPFEFNAFVFAQGVYAGTLSPVNMNSRFDGALFLTPARQVAALGTDGSIAADFIRYADADPLCCPSRGVTHVVYRVQQVSGQPVVGPVALSARAPAQVPVPLALPATGSGAESSWLGYVLLGLGAALSVVGARRRGLRR